MQIAIYNQKTLDVQELYLWIKQSLCQPKLKSSSVSHCCRSNIRHKSVQKNSEKHEYQQQPLPLMSIKSRQKSGKKIVRNMGINTRKPTMYKGYTFRLSHSVNQTENPWMSIKSRQKSVHGCLDASEQRPKGIAGTRLV